VGVSLFDRKTNEIVFDVNFWHYRASVRELLHTQCPSAAHMAGRGKPLIEPTITRGKQAGASIGGVQAKAH
jgi:hypothetical protein